MHYLGGKFRTKGAIGDYITKLIADDGITTYIEPFCGSLWVTCEIAKKSDVEIIASDSHESLILMWKAIQSGWIPHIPDNLEENEVIYNKYKNISGHSKEHGFYGFSLGYGGRYFSGFSRDGRGSRNYAKDAWSSISKRKLPYIADMDIKCCDYTDYTYVQGALIYCDPPYLGTTGYKGTDKFNHDTFWDWVRMMSEDNIVLVSECQAPSDFTAVLELNARSDIRTGKGNKNNSVRKEYLFRYI